MNIQIRQERSKDFHKVKLLLQAAFAQEPHSNQSEHVLVGRLRNSSAFIPELTLVAVFQTELVGHILLTKITVQQEAVSHEGLALAPVSVHPDYQRKGIGSQLIKEAHKRASALGYKFIVLIGHEDYYPKFGYEPAHLYGIQFPFEVPPQNAMVKALVEERRKGVTGRVQYPDAFFA